jgi:hypothetical protein
MDLNSHCALLLVTILENTLHFIHESHPLLDVGYGFIVLDWVGAMADVIDLEVK